MSGIVKRLEQWAHQNVPALRQKGVLVEERLLSPGSNVPWKAAIELMYGGIIVSYCVWERDVSETSLVVMNTNRNNQTIVMNDKIVDSADIVDTDLGEVVRKLLDGTFLGMEPDPKLTVTRPGEYKR